MLLPFVLCCEAWLLRPCISCLLSIVLKGTGSAFGLSLMWQAAGGHCNCSQVSRGVTSIVMCQVEEKRAVSQDLQLWISKEAVQDGYNLVVRTGRLVQEIHVTTQMPGDRMKQAVQRVLRNLV